MPNVIVLENGMAGRGPAGGLWDEGMAPVIRDRNSHDGGNTMWSGHEPASAHPQPRQREFSNGMRRSCDALILCVLMRGASPSRRCGGAKARGGSPDTGMDEVLARTGSRDVRFRASFSDGLSYV